jgi:NADPH-dependent F420 reductase
MTESLILTIGLIGGTGNLGPGLATRWASAGYGVIIGSRSEKKAQGIAEELNKKLDIESIRGMKNEDAIEAADICVMTVNHSAHGKTIEVIKDHLEGKILVDATARVDFRDPVPPDPPAAARLAQDVIGEAGTVVAAFQTIPAHALQENIGMPLDLDVLICADDDEAAAEVVKLVEGADMRAYLAGRLDNAIVAEGITALLIAMNKKYESKTGTIRISGL